MLFCPETAVFLCVVCLTPNEVFMVCQNEDPVTVLVDKAHGLVQIEGHTDGVSGEVFAIPSYLLHVIRDNDFSDLTGQSPICVDGFET